MFIGHYAVAFGAKALAPRTSLGTLILGALFIDLLWPTLVLLGWEQVRIEAGATAAVPLVFDHYPWTHSLLAVVLWALAVALIYQWRRHYLRGALVVGGAVVSHWLLDLLVHIPDLPLTPWGATLVGLGIWQSLWGTLLLELSLFAFGLWLYLRTTRAVDGIGRWALGAVGYRGLHGTALPRQHLRPATAQCHRDCLGRSGPVALRRLGLLAGAASHNCDGLTDC